MSTPAQLREAQEVTRLFQAAIAAEGGKAAIEALADWRGEPVNWTGPQATAWINRAVRRVLARRAVSRELGIAYYRLVRALALGVTVPRPGVSEAGVTLGDLRRAFEAAADAKVPANFRAPDVAIEVDPSLDSVLAENDAAEREARSEAQTVLYAHGPRSLAKKLAALQEEIKRNEAKPAVEVDAARDKAHRESGARASAAEGRMAMNGARGVVFDAINADPKALGWARVSDGDPCYFCAMLLSRGFVYKSESSATFGDGDLYHDNCQCSAVPVFSVEQYKNDPQFDANRRYKAAWKDHKNDWRGFINAERRAARSSGQPTETAQEASE